MAPMTNPVFRIILVRTVQASVLALAAHQVLHWPWAGPHALGLFLTPGLCGYFVFVFVAPWTWGLPIETRLGTRERVVALTFDDGPSCAATPRILDTLEACNVQATFFVLGDQLEGSEAMLGRMVAQGHTVGVHGQTHAPLVLLPWGAVSRMLAAAKASVRRACPDASVHWLRAPHGFKTIALPFLARRAGLQACAWSVNSHDYQLADPEQIAGNVLKRIHPGAIVLLHDGAANRATADALPLILDGLTRRGYRCVPLPPPGGSG